MEDEEHGEDDDDEEHEEGDDEKHDEDGGGFSELVRTSERGHRVETAPTCGNGTSSPRGRRLFAADACPTGGSPGRRTAAYAPKIRLSHAPTPVGGVEGGRLQRVARGPRASGPALDAVCAQADAQRRFVE